MKKCKFGRYIISFEVVFRENEDGKRDIGNLFIKGALSDLENTHRLNCEDVQVKEKSK